MMRAEIRPPTMTMAKGRWESEPIARERAAGSKAEDGDQHGHHDRAQAQHGAFDGGIFDRVAADAELINVFEHDHAGFHRDAEERKESNAGRNAQMRAGDQQRQKATDRRDGHVGENQASPFRRAEHGVENNENHQQRDRDDNRQALLRALLAFVFAGPIDVVADRAALLFPSPASSRLPPCCRGRGRARRI